MSRPTPPPIQYHSEGDPPYDFVPVAPNGDALLPEEFRSRVYVHTVHDGDALPDEYRFRKDGTPLVDPEELERRHIAERDWGANLVASKVASALGLAGYGRCRIARVLLDFNRFPGSTPPTTIDPLQRLAISPPYSLVLDHAQKVQLLSRYYDRISDLIEERWLDGNLIMLAIHTFDEHNPSLTRRPALSLVHAEANYLRESRMPYGVFDPLYPDILAESTCSRILRDRISLNLERTGFRVLHNHPYAMPAGSMEVRAQVWYFFDYVRKRYVDAHPDAAADPAFQMVWEMLLNTNQRHYESESLRGYLHRYRRIPQDEVGRFQAAERAYRDVAAFLERHNLVSDYRRSPDRPSSLGMEVRKDLVCEVDPKTGRPLPLAAEHEERATLIGKVLAGAIRTYFETDTHYG